LAVGKLERQTAPESATKSLINLFAILLSQFLLWQMRYLGPIT